jgi:hypothetical protein
MKRRTQGEDDDPRSQRRVRREEKKEDLRADEEEDDSVAWFQATPHDPQPFVSRWHFGRELCHACDLPRAHAIHENRSCCEECGQHYYHQLDCPLEWLNAFERREYRVRQIAYKPEASDVRLASFSSANYRVQFQLYHEMWCVHPVVALINYFLAAPDPRLIWEQTSNVTGWCGAKVTMRFGDWHRRSFLGGPCYHNDATCDC